MDRAATNLAVVIMAGGAGTRFWPLSTPELPKQFMTAFGDESLYQETVARALTLVPADRIIVVTNQSFIGMARAQAPDIPGAQVVGEPYRRDTAPAVALATAISEKLWPGSVNVVMPADHVIRDSAGFRKNILAAVEKAQEGALVTLGIPPTYPATTYGYLETASSDVKEPQRLIRFVEKPDGKRAAEFLATGRFFWNSGVFVFRAARMMKDLKRHLPGMEKLMSGAVEQFQTEKFVPELRKAMEVTTAVSIDYGVMEKAEDIWVVPAGFDWSDAGGWLAAIDLVEPDGDDNRVRGAVILDDCQENLLLSEDPGKPLICAGLKGVIVASTPEGILVCKKEAAEGIKPLVQNVLESRDRTAREDHRPWGYYVVLEDLPDHKVKRIVVDPGQRLSLQRHQYRGEHWHVVSGCAMVTKDDEEIQVGPGESAEIPQGVWHRVRNPGTEPLVFIEVQHGTYFGEDDIERKDDDYGRVEQV